MRIQKYKLTHILDILHANIGIENYCSETCRYNLLYKPPVLPPPKKSFTFHFGVYVYSCLCDQGKDYFLWYYANNVVSSSVI